MNNILDNKQYKYKHKNSYLTLKQCNGVFVGAKYSYENGHPLNRHFILHLQYYENNPVDLRNMIFEYTNKWLAYRNIQVAYISCWEVGDVKGLHLHWLIHIPNGMQVAFKRYLIKNLTRKGVNAKERNRATQEKVLVVTSISYGLNGTDLSGINALCRYITKGRNPSDTIVDLYGEVVSNPRFQGKVPFQRLGMSKIMHNAQRLV